MWMIIGMMWTENYSPNDKLYDMTMGGGVILPPIFTLLDTDIMEDYYVNWNHILTTLHRGVIPCIQASATVYP